MTAAKFESSSAKPTKVQSKFVSAQLSQEELYAELINSIPQEERAGVETEINSSLVAECAAVLQEKIERAEFILFNQNESRTGFLAACRSVRDKKISMAQLASLHILDAAIHTLYLNRYEFFRYSSVDHETGEPKQVSGAHKSVNHVGALSKVEKHLYSVVVNPDQNAPLSDLPGRMQLPLVQRFFNLTPVEWNEFCKEMDQAPQSEQFYHVLIAPELGCWSQLGAKIQRISSCMRVLDRLVPSNYGLFEEMVMLVPSFTMFQAALNAKAFVLKRKSVELVPTYGLMEAEHYAAIKEAGKIALTMYLPEENPTLRYDIRGKFRITIDGYQHESAFVGVMHDFYHAMRELSLSEQVALARFRLAKIAKKHPDNTNNPLKRAVNDILVDGEFNSSYPPELDTMMAPEHRSRRAALFGEIFSFMGKNLHPNLRIALIHDMVVNATFWKQSYNIGPADLRLEDISLYDQIKNGTIGVGSLEQTVASSGKDQTPGPTAASKPTAVKGLTSLVANVSFAHPIPGPVVIGPVMLDPTRFPIKTPAPAPAEQSPKSFGAVVDVWVAMHSSKKYSKRLTASKATEARGFVDPYTKEIIDIPVYINDDTEVVYDFNSVKDREDVRTLTPAKDFRDKVDAFLAENASDPKDFKSNKAEQVSGSSSSSTATMRNHALASSSAASGHHSTSGSGSGSAGVSPFNRDGSGFFSQLKRTISSVPEEFSSGRSFSK